MRSGYVTAPGYLSDLFSSFYPLGFASPVLRGLGLDRFGLEWTHAPDVLTHLLPDGRAATVNRDLETTMASMEKDQLPADCMASAKPMATGMCVGHGGNDPSSTGGAIVSMS